MRFNNWIANYGNGPYAVNTSHSFGSLARYAEEEEPIQL